MPIKPDIWDREFSAIRINKEHLKEWAKRYRMDVRFCLGRLKDEFDLEQDRKRILNKELV